MGVPESREDNARCHGKGNENLSEEALVEAQEVECKGDNE